MKQLILIVALAISINASAQDDKTVTLVVSGQGKTQEEAKQNALRSAIEQAFGTFISSKTEILNDNLVKDEIVSVANGNIQKFEIISDVQIPNGLYATSLKATVSVTKLTSFVESKGVIAEFKGNIFAFNINQQKLNEKNELIALKEIISVTNQLINKSYFGSITLKEPYLKSGDIYTLPYKIEIHTNENINTAVKYFSDNLKKLSLVEDDVNNYLKLNTPLFEVIQISPVNPIDGQFTFVTNKNQYCPLTRANYDASKSVFQSVFLRNELSVVLLKNFLIDSYKQIFKFKIITNEGFNLNIDNYLTMRCDESQRGKQLSWGVIPFFIPDENLYDRYNRPIIQTINDLKCYGSSGSNESYSISLKALEKYVDQRCSSNRKDIPVLNFITHNYQKNGLIYCINASSELKLSDLGKISNIKIEYIK